MTTSTITDTIVAEAERMAAVDRRFGLHYVLKLEPTVFNITEALAIAYTGGYWEFHELSNGGFYMAPRFDTEFQVSSANGYESKLSPNALGLAACLSAYSHLSFGGNDFADTFARHFHLLREYALTHPESAAIMAVID
jgi:Antirestriction protein